MTLRAMYLLAAGLCICLAAAFFVRDSLALIAGLYSSYCIGVGAALGLFINGNVQVHRTDAANQKESTP